MEEPDKDLGDGTEMITLDCSHLTSVLWGVRKRASKAGWTRWKPEAQLLSEDAGVACSVCNLRDAAEASAGILVDGLDGSSAGFFLVFRPTASR